MLRSDIMIEYIQFGFAGVTAYLIYWMTQKLDRKLDLILIELKDLNSRIDILSNRINNVNGKIENYLTEMRYLNEISK